jgi:hypothetical protein
VSVSRNAETTLTGTHEYGVTAELLKMTELRGGKFAASLTGKIESNDMNLLRQIESGRFWS